MCSSRNLLWTMKLPPTYHLHDGNIWTVHLMWLNRTTIHTLVTALLLDTHLDALYIFYKSVFSSAYRVRGEDMAPRIVLHPSDVVVKAGNPATLSCRADGSPKVTIEWLRNGQPLKTLNADGHLEPLVLLEGSLFFLSVGEGSRGQSHEGVYACVARNSAGTATSRNASLYIAGKTGGSL